MNSKQAKLV